jgi:hypothetical protein
LNARGELHPPVGEVPHRRFTNEFCEPLCQHRSGHRDLSRELLDGPIANGICVEQAQRLADVDVVHAGEPASLIRGKTVHVLAEDLDEHQLR